jgi:hypothetical protein
LLLNAPQLDATVGKVRQQQEKLVVCDVDVLWSERLRGQFAPTRGVFYDAAGVEYRL